MTAPARWTRLCVLAFATTLATLLAGCGGLTGRGAGPLTGDAAVREIERLETLAADDATEPYWPFRIAEIHAGLGDPARADASLDEALRRDPGHAPSLSLRAKSYYRAGRHEDAIALLESAPRTGRPTDDTLALGLALHYEAVGRVDEADAIVFSVLERGDDWKTNGAAMTYLRLRGSGFTAARDVAQRALIADDSAVNRNNYGIALLYAGEPKEARKHFEKATRKDPELPGPHYNLAIVDHFYLFDATAARRSFARYRELSDDDPDGLEAALARSAADVANLSEEKR